MTREEREAAKLAGAALVLESGVSYRQAAAIVDIPFQTIHDAVRRMADDPDAIKAAADRVAAANVYIAETAARAVAKGLEHATYDQQMRAWGIASDKVAAHQGWGARGADSQSSPAATLDAAARMIAALEGRSLTLSVSASQPDADTLEHSPSTTKSNDGRQD